MLKYLWMTTQELFLAVTLITFMHVFLGRLIGRAGRRVHGVFILGGSAAAIVLAVLKYNTNWIISSRWNHYIYAVVIVLTVCFFVFSVIFGRREGDKRSVGGIVLSVLGGLLAATLIFYSLPTVLLYPFSFNTMGNGYLSEYYLVRLAGWVAGLVLLVVYARLLSACLSAFKRFGALPIALNAGLIGFTIYCGGRFFIPWVNRANWLHWPVKYDASAYGWAGKYMMFTANYSMLFVWLVLGIAAVMTILHFAENIRVTEMYENAAQRRKLRAMHRNRRRVAVAAFVCLVLFVVILTYVKAYDTRVIELSAPESYTVEDGKILIPMEDVSDEHLHRFEYTTENNISVRWIVVKKPNSASFGVGLDACEVCGNAGYFERNGQVICKRCDVVMNINTIGFKGGCNPIPLAYEVDGGNLVITLEDIEAGEKEFR